MQVVSNGFVMMGQEEAVGSYSDGWEIYNIFDVDDEEWTMAPCIAIYCEDLSPSNDAGMYAR